MTFQGTPEDILQCNQCASPKTKRRNSYPCDNVEGRGRWETKALARPVHEKAEWCQMEAVTHGFCSIALGKIQNATFLRPPLILQVPETTADVLEIRGLESESHSRSHLTLKPPD